MKRLKVGTSVIANVPREVWEYEVSVKQVLRQWFGYRKKNRERPQIWRQASAVPTGGYPAGPLAARIPSELINGLNVLGMSVELEPKQANLLERTAMDR